MNERGERGDEEGIGSEMYRSYIREWVVCITALEG
jgi:hypothetical protein